MGDHTVECIECGRTHKGYCLSCECSSFLRANYLYPLRVRDLPGLWKYLDWLPCEKPLETRSGPITFHSNALGSELGLDKLYVSYSGYWPERDAWNMTCSFKDLEASPTISRAMENDVASMVIASAGNTARAFSHVSNKTGFPVYLVVPEFGIDNVWTPDPSGDNVHLISVKGDYFDAIRLSQRMTEERGIFPEGGARNIARRDGMGTVMLDGAMTMGRIPDHYFQAVGSGPGAIGSLEMANRLRDQGFEGRVKLHLSQNLPFAPMVRAWKAGRKELVPEADMPDAEESIRRVYAKVLTNRKPPYSVKGGVYDALVETDGHTYGITNSEARSAGRLFEALEGIDILPAASVALASLIKAVEEGNAGRGDHILLNVTGGGEIRLKKDMEVHPIRVAATAEGPEAELEELL